MDEDILKIVEENFWDLIDGTPHPLIVLIHMINSWPCVIGIYMNKEEYDKKAKDKIGKYTNLVEEAMVDLNNKRVFKINPNEYIFLDLFYG